jgi:DivIVA domain-containing protein
VDRDDAAGGRGSEWNVKPSRRITPEEVQAKEFGTARVRVGYRMHEVDEFLDQITDTLSGLIAENERLRSERSRGASSGRACPCR